MMEVKAPIGLMKGANGLRRNIGLECEIAEWNGLELWKGIEYKVVGDGSVSPSGREMVIPPASGDQFVLNVGLLGEAFEHYACTMNNSCGLHVHIDARDYNYWDIRRLIWLWEAVETDVRRYFVGQSRVNNTYCKKMMGIGWILETALPGMDLYESMKYQIGSTVLETKMANPESKGIVELREWMRGWQEARNHRYGNGSGQMRYRSMNLVSWFHRGTVEFRVKEGCTKADEICMWALLCGWVVEVAGNSTDSAIREVRKMKEFMNMRKKNPFNGAVEFVLPSALRSWIGKKLAGAGNNLRTSSSTIDYIGNQD